jgi:putative tryptophan/tyrosine transport system substrate-binding protein
MKRRDLLILLAASSVSCWPVEAAAQRADRMRHIAVLMSYAEADSEAQKWVAAFRTALRELGWTEGRNIRIQIRWATGDPDTIGRLAKELVESRPELILASTTPATAALLEQTRTIPIVFALVSDPVGSGFVASFPRPGGNVSGFTTMEPTMAEKWLELLKEAVPHVARLAFLFNPPSAPYIDVYLKPFLAAARSLAVEVIVAPVRNISDLEFAVEAQARASNGGLLIWPDAFMTAHRVAIASLLARHRLPAVSPFRVFAESGCLLSYGSDSVDNFRRAASYVDRILRGEKPAALPVQQPTKFELVINLKTAKALGLTIPPSLLQRADQVIE